mgnify:CR=1 FL=1
MHFKSILTVLSDEKLGDLTMEHAAELTQAHDAHLDVLCLGVDRTQQGYYYGGANAMVMRETLARAQDEAEALAAHAREWLGRTDLRWGVEEDVAILAQIGQQVAGRARFSDLVVLPKPYGKDHGVELEPVIEGALFEGLTPVMVVPDDATPMVAPKSVLVAWNGGAEALRSVRAAMPLLRGAERVHVVLVDPPRQGPTRSDPGGVLAQYLSRHGVKAEIDILAKTRNRVSDVLLRHAGDTAAQMIVMGAYGHSRFREAILGGATRNMLEQTDVPVFMAH